MLTRVALLFGGVAAHAGDASGALWSSVCTKGDPSSAFPFCDATKGLDERAADLVSRMTLEEKQSILGNTANAVPRLGIPAYQWWSEGLHGALEPCVADGDTWKCPTNFPAPSAMASALNDSLYLAVGQTVGTEGRAISNLRKHNNVVSDGLTYWAPNANMERDPRWGRNQEAPGEDPQLTARYIVQYVRGLQEGEDKAHAKLAATCKHFVANSLEASEGFSRHNFDAQIPLPELVDYYLPAFKACVQDGKALGIMCSYNAVNGVPMCANREFLTDLLREKWGFDGYVTSDCGAIADIWSQHHFAPDGTVATAAGLRAGCDTDCGDQYGKFMVDAVNRSILSQETVDSSLKRLAKIQMRLGLFEPKEGQVYFDKSRYGINQIDTEEHQQLALEAALQSIVLLKNDGGILPLKRGQKLAVIGPHTEATEALMSNYHGERCHGAQGKYSCITTPLAAITAANKAGVTASSKGVDVSSSFDNISAAVETAKAADAVILLMGIDGSQEAEGRDRKNTTLPGLQVQLVEDILALKKPVVLVLVHGGAMTLGHLKDSAPAIVDAFYGGEQGSEALASVLFGDYNPSGKLPITMYPVDFLDQNPITQMSVRKAPGRTHLYYTGQPEFSFGTGLSYSKWVFETVTASHNIISTDADEDVMFKVRIRNLGPLAGRQRVLAFVRFPSIQNTIHETAPKQRLWDYQGTELPVGGSADFTFTLKPDVLAYSNEFGDRVLGSGTYVLVFSDGHTETNYALGVVGPTAVRETLFGHVSPQTPVVV